MKKNKTKLAIIGTVGLPANYGGFETLTSHLVDELKNQYEMTVYCSGKRYAKSERKTTYNGARLKYLPLDANGIQSILYDTLSILHAIFFAEVLLILGVSGAWILPFVKTFTNKKIIISIDGIEWKRDKWSLPAKMYLYWAEQLAVKYSHIDISDNESIQNYTAIRYGSLSNVIEYGGDHTLEVQPNPSDFDRYAFLNTAYAFKVCRIEPENNVHIVLEAFASCRKYHLVMVGNWGNSLYGKDLKDNYSRYDHIHLLDPIYDQRELDLLRGNARLYIHGHSAGGTNPSLVEAMYLSLPIFAFGVTYNRTTTDHKSMYFKTTEQLIDLIEQTSHHELLFIAQKMKKIAHARYRWSVIANKYHQLILSTFKIKEKDSIVPSFNQLDPKVLGQLEMGHLTNTHFFYESKKTA